MSIGERISELRKKQNISQVQLAKAMNVSRQAVSKWENDQTAPDTVNLIRLADLLGTDSEYLATGAHSQVKVSPTVVTVDNIVEKIVEKTVEVEKIVEVERIVEVEKIVEVEVEKIVEVDRIVERVVEVPTIKRVTRVKYLRNPLEFAAVAFLGLAIGIVIGLLL